MSILDDDDILLDDRSIELDWFKENLLYDYDYNAPEVTIENDEIIIKGHAYIKSCVEEIPIKIKCIYGNFDVSGSALKSLENCPEEVYGSFKCSNCFNLTSLKGGPRIVTGFYDCDNTEINTLEGCAERVGSLNCSSTQIITLKGCPSIIDNSLNCSDNNYLISLQGCTEKIGKNINISGCYKLTSLKYLPEVINGNLNCLGCLGLKCLSDVKKVMGTINYSGCSGLTFTWDNKPIDLPEVGEDKTSRRSITAAASKIYDFYKKYGWIC